MDITAPGGIGYLVIAVLVALDSVFPVLPSEAIVISTAACATGSPGLLALVVATTGGAAAGDALMFGVGRRVARLPAARSSRRWTERVAVSPTTGTIVAGRFLPFGRSAVAVASGAAGMPWRRFLLASAVGAPVWAVVTVGLGRLGGSVTDDAVLRAGIGIGVGAVVTAAVALVRWHRRPAARTP
jgi:membrane protein DedA with SNARE-associated domain